MDFHLELSVVVTSLVSPFFRIQTRAHVLNAEKKTICRSSISVCFVRRKEVRAIKNALGSSVQYIYRGKWFKIKRTQDNIKNPFKGTGSPD
jgi:hypothetical protein